MGLDAYDICDFKAGLLGGLGKNTTTIETEVDRRYHIVSLFTGVPRHGEMGRPREWHHLEV
jgi:hypothetical protein